MVKPIASTELRLGMFIHNLGGLWMDHPVAYKLAWDPAGTIREMAKWEGHFDKQLFNAFVKMVGIYPVGSLMRLSSQRLAVVIEPGRTSLVKPKVKVFFFAAFKSPYPNTGDCSRTAKLQRDHRWP